MQTKGCRTTASLTRILALVTLPPNVLECHAPNHSSVNSHVLPLSAELYENLGHMGASIKQHLVEGMRNMWHQLNEIARSHTSSDQAQIDLPQGG